jgi:hypothetical protein
MRRNKKYKVKKEEEMKKVFFMMNVLLVLIFASAGLAAADDAKPAGTTLDDIKKLLGLSVYVQGGYTYNFKNPDSQENELRVFDHKANSFTLDLGQLVFTKDAPVGGVGYKLKLSAGETAKLIHSRGLGNANDEFDLTEAYVEYVAPLGEGLKFRFGKFVTMHGAEVIEAKDDMNYSRSLLFNYAIPFTHTGLMVGYAFSNVLTTNLYLVNGWDNTDDNNKGKTGGVTLGLTPIEEVALTFSVMYGPEQDNNNSDNRDYATDKHAAPDGSNAKWYGIAGYVKYDFSDFFSTTVRAEYFDDKDGVRTLTPQKLKEVTFTPEFRVAKSVIVRPEYRHDWSDKEVFDSSTRKSQDTVALGVMYTW